MDISFSPSIASLPFSSLRLWIHHNQTVHHIKWQIFLQNVLSVSVICQFHLQTETKNETTSQKLIIYKTDTNKFLAYIKVWLLKTLFLLPFLHNHQYSGLVWMIKLCNTISKKYEKHHRTINLYHYYI